MPGCTKGADHLGVIRIRKTPGHNSRALETIIWVLGSALSCITDLHWSAGALPGADAKTITNIVGTSSCINGFLCQRGAGPAITCCSAVGNVRGACLSSRSCSQCQQQCPSQSQAPHGSTQASHHLVQGSNGQADGHNQDVQSTETQVGEEEGARGCHSMRVSSRPGQGSIRQANRNIPGVRSKPVHAQEDWGWVWVEV
mmetsp:Transcript_100203/g.292200  ORF Transcript_100203/g.292200 Transcript_100203/m.292200 type:complete len:199 (-) Transcript_100203:748-1344(-)